MARISEAPEGGKFRARAAAALDGQAGVWGNADLLCVTFDAAGDLIIGGLATTRGVIWVPEGRKDTSVASYDNVVGGRMYTVFTWAVIQEMEIGTSPTMDEGDSVWAAASGDVLNVAAGTATGAGAGAIYLGQILNDETRPGAVGTGLRMILNVNGFTVGLA